VPAGGTPPVVLDMANSVVAAGKIRVLKKEGKPIPEGWALNQYGEPTTDPDEAMKGILLAIGGYKGYGIALAIDLLCGVMTGSNYGTHFPGFLADNLKDPTDVGSVFAAINIESFMALPEFKAAMDKAIREIKTSVKAEGVPRIYIPGEIELETKAERLKNGIPIPDAVVQDFTALGKELGLPFPATS